MNKIAKFIVKHRTLIAIIMALLVIVSSIVLFFVKINSDVISYLPKDKPTKQGLNYLVENFNLKGDVTIGIKGLDKDHTKEAVDQISKLPHVKKDNGVMWIGTIEDQTSSITAVIPGIIDQKLLSDMLTPKIDDSEDPVFIVMVFLSVPSASNEATKTINDIVKILDSQKPNATETFEYRFGGSAAITRDIFNSVFGEVWKFAIIGLLVIIIILVLTTKSLIEPIILLLTLGASILLNMGSNIIFGEVSSVTTSISAILQLGLSMDYAIFLIHAYYKEKELGYDDETAMQRAIPKTFSTVFASALTTVFGFIALFFMQFQMGADLGRVLAKGVFLSMLTVLLLQPSLILIFKRPFAKYSHKVLAPSFQKPASYLVRHKYVVFLVCLFILIPSIILQSKVTYSYMDLGTQSKNPTALETTVNTMGNTIVVVVPIKKDANGQLTEEELEKQKRFVKDLKSIKQNGNQVVQNVMGLFSMIPENNIVVDGFLQKNLFKFEAFKQFVNNEHTIYSVMLDSKINPESEECMNIIDDINAYVKKEFGDNAEYYITGTAQSVKDLKEITPNDFLIVTLVSMLSIFIILLFTIKNFGVSVLLIALIELGIFFNIAISVLFKVHLNFMAYIVISAVQLGATVDYAILYTINFKRNKEHMSIKEAARQASKDTGASILTSASIIAGSCLSVSVFSGNLIIKQLTMLIGRGALISAVLVLFALPALLCMFDKNVKNRRVKKYLKYTKLDDYSVYMYNLQSEEETLNKQKIKKRNNKNKNKEEDNNQIIISDDSIQDDQQETIENEIKEDS